MSSNQSAKTQRRLEELLHERYPSSLPVWIRSPRSGLEHFTGLSRSKLYELEAKGKIVSRSIREPGQIRGTKLWNLKSILDYIDGCGPKEAA